MMAKLQLIERIEYDRQYDMVVYRDNFNKVHCNILSCLQIIKPTSNTVEYRDNINTESNMFLRAINLFNKTVEHHSNYNNVHNGLLKAIDWL